MSLVFHLANHLDNDLAGGVVTYTGAPAVGSTPHAFPQDSGIYSSGDYATVGNLPSLDFDGSTPFSVGLWLRVITAPTAFGVYFGKREATGRGWAIMCGGGAERDHVNFGLRGPSGEQIVVDTGARSASWKHYLFTYDGSGLASGVTCRKDTIPYALQVENDNLASADISTTTEAGIRLLGSAEASSLNADFEIADVRVWDHVATDKDSLQAYSAANPNGDWKLNDRSIFLTTQGGYDWLGRAQQTQMSDGTVVMMYRASNEHESSSSAEWFIHFRDTHGEWSEANKTLGGDPVSGWPLGVISPGSPNDGVIFEAPNGDLCVMVSYTSSVRHGTRLWRSTDKGLSWTNEGLKTVAGETEALNLASGQVITVGSRLYATLWFDAGANRLPPLQCWLTYSDDNGVTWTQHTILGAGTGVNESGLTQLPNGDLLIIMRHDDLVTTWSQKIVNGVAEAVVNITAQVGGMHRPMLTWVDNVLALTGRQYVGAGNQHTVLYHSVDNGDTWGDAVNLDGVSVNDCGYTGVFSCGRYLHVLSYAGTNAAAALTQFELTYIGSMPEDTKYTSPPRIVFGGRSL